MKGIAALFGLFAVAPTGAQQTTLDFSPEKWPLPSPPIADCADDFHRRGRPTETPVKLADVAQVREILDNDLKGIEPEGLAGFRAVEPVCFYLLPDGRLLMRDGRGFEYYFRQILRWIPERVDVPRQQTSE
jgi:hypothetical protein